MTDLVAVAWCSGIVDDGATSLRRNPFEGAMALVLKEDADAEIVRLREVLTEISAARWMPNDEFADYKLRWEWVTSLAYDALEAS